MSGADEAEASRLRVGPYASDADTGTDTNPPADSNPSVDTNPSAGTNPSADTNPAVDPVDSAAVNAATQLLPMIEGRSAFAGPDPDLSRRPPATAPSGTAPSGPIPSGPVPSGTAEPGRVGRLGPGGRRTSSTTESNPTKVRAVARRAPAALPALGTDGPRDVPASAKTTVDRRRREQGRESVELDGAPQPSDEPEDEGAPSGESSSDLDARDFYAHDPGVRDAGSADPDSAGALDDADRDAAARNAVYAPTVLTPLVGMPTMALPMVTEHAPVVLDEIPALTDTRPAPEERYAPEEHPAPEAYPASEEHSASEEPATEDHAEPVDHAGTDFEVGTDFEAGSVAEAGPGDRLRPGPPVLKSDSWDALPDRSLGNSLYHGRRRAALPWARVLLVVALVLAVAAIFLVPLAFGGPAAPQAGDQGGAIVTDDTGGQSSTDSGGQLVPAASSPGSKGGTAKKSAAPSGSVPASPGAPTSTAARLTSTPPTEGPPVTFTTVSLQAESATVSSPSWQVDSKPSCNTGSAVVRTGKWSEYGSTPGSITFTASITTAGSYQVTIYSVISSGPDRKAEITVNGASVTSPAFPAGCLITRAVTVSLGSGSNQIRFTNQNARGPSIDRIEISKV